MHDIQSAWHNGKILSTLMCDFKGYYDHIGHKALVRTLYSKGIPLPLIRWVYSFLSSHSATVTLENLTLPVIDIDDGVPQGSPISPILSSYFSTPLLEKFHD